MNIRNTNRVLDKHLYRFPMMYPSFVLLNFWPILWSGKKMNTLSEYVYKHGNNMINTVFEYYVYCFILFILCHRME